MAQVTTFTAAAAAAAASNLLTLRTALNQAGEHGITDGRFIVRPESELVHFDAYQVAGLQYPAFDAPVGGFDVWDRDTGTLTWVRYAPDHSHKAAIEALTKVPGQPARRWRVRGA